jgi:hypothetical protein
MLWLNGEFSLGLSKPVKTHKPPKPPEIRERRGQAFTSYGRRMVRSAAFWLEKTWGRQNLSFLTTTVPTLPNRDIGKLSAEWCEVTRRYKQELERELSRKGITSEVLLVTEIQEKRFRETGLIAPHLHIVFRGRKSRYDNWAISKERARELWENVLSAIVGYRLNAPASTRIEKIKKSVENYLSKYMSKGGKVIEEIIADGRRHLLPTSWWGMTNTLRDTIKAGCKRIPQEMADILYDQRENLQQAGIIRWCHIVMTEIAQSHGEFIEIPVAFVGKFAKPEHGSMFIIE